VQVTLAPECRVVKVMSAIGHLEPTWAELDGGLDGLAQLLELGGGQEDRYLARVIAEVDAECRRPGEVAGRVHPHDSDFVMVKVDEGGS
jgi:hypothetical protein